MFASILAISLGAALGGLSRWVLSFSLNGLFPSLPPGTLAANLIGGYLIGLAVAWFSFHPEVSPLWKLMVKYFL